MAMDMDDGSLQLITKLEKLIFPASDTLMAFNAFNDAIRCYWQSRWMVGGALCKERC